MGTMASSDRKLRKLRGHRKHPSGRGMAGSLKHHKNLINLHHPGFHGKVGFRRYHHLGGHKIIKSINVDKLHSLVEFGTADINPSQGLVIDCLAAGYHKVLGAGDIIPGQPLIVKARYFSEKAEAKIKENGGACVLVA